MKYLNTCDSLNVTHYRVIFFKLVNDVEYGSDERTSCPSGQCVSVRVKIQSGTLKEGDCYNRFIQEPSYIQAGQVRHRPCLLLCK